MAKRYTYKYCGRYFYGVSYSMPGAADTQEAKRDRQRCVSEARQKINDKRAAVQFEQLMATNFTPSDLVVTLTYRDDALPPTLCRPVAMTVIVHSSDFVSSFSSSLSTT